MNKFLQFLFETRGGQAVIIVVGAIIVFIWTGIRSDQITGESYSGRIERLDKDVRLGRGRRALLSSKPSNYDYYWVIRKSDGSDQKTEVPYSMWEAAKPGQKVVKVAGKRWPDLQPFDENEVKAEAHAKAMDPAYATTGARAEQTNAIMNELDGTAPKVSPSPSSAAASAQTQAASPSAPGGTAATPAAGQCRYAIGQTWKYTTRPSEPESQLTVCGLEQDPRYGIIVHVCVSGLKLKTGKAPEAVTAIVNHMPIAAAALDQSVQQMVGTQAQLANIQQIQQAYGAWKREFQAGALVCSRHRWRTA